MSCLMQPTGVGSFRLCSSWAAWMCEIMPRRSAALRQEGATGQIMGLLLGLDAVRFLLLVDPAQDSPGTAAGGLLGGLRQYLPQPWACPDQAHDSSLSAQQPRHANPAPVRTTPSEAALLSCFTSAVNSWRNPSESALGMIRVPAQGSALLVLAS